MDHEHIRATRDRSFTTTLVERLLSDVPDAAERADLESTLRALDDVRAVVKLQAAGENTGVEPIIRTSALSVVTGMLGATRLPIREWWGSNEPVLRFAAANVLPDRQFADLVEPVLNDPIHPMLARVLASMDVGFEEPRWQSLKIRALTHSRDAVRTAAATCLLWDEPLSAEPALIRATRDLNVDVAIEAVSTLMYYPTIAVVECLDGAVGSPNTQLAEASRTSLERVLSDIADAVSIAPDAPALARWKDLLNGHRDRIASDPTVALSDAEVVSSLDRRPHAMTAWSAELEAQLTDSNGAWAIKYAHLRMLDPLTIANADQARIVEFLSRHPDPEVRSIATRHLPRLRGGSDALVEMLNDPMTTVAKAAMYALHDVADADLCVALIRDTAWEAVVDGTRTGTRVSEALRTFVRHAVGFGTGYVADRLSGLLVDSRESVRASAIEQLVSLNAIDALKSTLPMLTEAPEVTWSVHGTLLDAASRFSLPVDHAVLRRLASADHAWVAAAVAKLLPGA